MSVKAFVLIVVDPAKTVTVFEQLRAVSGIAEVYQVMGPYDIVFLRNVMIYFDVPIKKDILRRVRQVLRPDGYFMLGSAETTIGPCNFSQASVHPTARPKVSTKASMVTGSGESSHRFTS